MHLSSSIVETKTTPTVANYPTFEFAKNYKNQANSHVSGTAYANGWYLPALSELFDIWKVKDTVDAKSNLCGGSKFDDAYYWTSSQFYDPYNTNLNSGAYKLRFYNWYGFQPDGKYIVNYHYTSYVCCIRVFN